MSWAFNALVGITLCLREMRLDHDKEFEMRGGIGDGRGGCGILA